MPELTTDLQAQLLRLTPAERWQAVVTALLAIASVSHTTLKTAPTLAFNSFATAQLITPANL